MLVGAPDGVGHNDTDRDGGYGEDGDYGYDEDGDDEDASMTMRIRC